MEAIVACEARLETPLLRHLGTVPQLFLCDLPLQELPRPPPTDAALYLELSMSTPVSFVMQGEGALLFA